MFCRLIQVLNCVFLYLLYFSIYTKVLCFITILNAFILVRILCVKTCCTSYNYTKNVQTTEMIKQRIV